MRSTLSWAALILTAHILAAIFLVGYGLFWTVMSAAVRRESATDRAQLLEVAAHARWPLAGNKISLSGIGWLVLAAVVLTGGLALPHGFALSDLFSGTKYSSLLLTKLVLIGLLVVTLL